MGVQYDEDHGQDRGLFCYLLCSSVANAHLLQVLQKKDSQVTISCQLANTVSKLLVKDLILISLQPGSATTIRQPSYARNTTKMTQKRFCALRVATLTPSPSFVK